MHIMHNMLRMVAAERLFSSRDHRVKLRQAPSSSMSAALGIAVWTAVAGAIFRSHAEHLAPIVGIAG